MDNLNLAQLISTTPDDFARSVQKDRLGLEASLRENEYKKSLTDQQRFQTERGQALLPTDLLEAQQKTDPKLHESNILKSDAEATTQQVAAQKALRMQSKEDFAEQTNMVFDKGNQVIRSALGQAMLGREPRDFLPQLQAQLIRDPEKGAEISTLLQPYMNLPREEFIKQATQTLEQMEKVRASLDPEQIRAAALARTKESTSSDEQLASDIRRLHPGDSPAQIQARIDALEKHKVNINAASIPRTKEVTKEMSSGQGGFPMSKETTKTGPAAPQPAARTPATSVPAATRPGISPERAAKEAELLRKLQPGKQ